MSLTNFKVDGEMLEGRVRGFSKASIRYIRKDAKAYAANLEEGDWKHPLAKLG
jgi:hypothetical protein